MSRTVGFRVEPDCINWAVVDGTSEAPVLFAADSLAAPVRYKKEAQALSWYRQNLIDLLEKYVPIDAVGVRYPEPFGSRSSDSARKRCRIEGIVLEAANSLSLAVVTGPLVTISKNLGSKSAKHYLESDELRGLDWSKYTHNLREAILTAASVLE